MRFFNFLAAALALTGASAHPGDDIIKEVKAREAIINQLKHRSLAHCADHIKRSGISAQSVARRHLLAQNLITKKNLTNRALNPLSINHNPPVPYTLTTPITTIFSANPSCLLAPETTEGPFYLLGVPLRFNLIADQPGVALHLDLLVIDTATCTPVTDGSLIEIWSANATGVYGGVSSRSNAPSDPSNKQNAWLRGAQRLDPATGTAQFATIFPGHYPGRAPHIHVMIHHRGAQVLPNGTIQDAVATHTGQLFFDQEVVETVEGRAPYVENGAELLRNEGDYYVPLASRDGNDPFVSYVFLDGRGVEGGLLGWMTVGVDFGRERGVRVAGTLVGEEGNG